MVVNRKKRELLTPAHQLLDRFKQVVSNFYGRYAYVHVSILGVVLVACMGYDMYNQRPVL